MIDQLLFPMRLLSLSCLSFAAFSEHFYGIHSRKQSRIEIRQNMIIALYIALSRC